MSPEFCSHLDTYSKKYSSAEVAYEECLEKMDQVLGGIFSNGIVEKLESALNNWEHRTRDLRGNFSSLTEKGEVLLPKEGGNETPVCAHCGQVVPRLEFAEFQLQEDGSLLFRGQELSIPQALPI